MGGIGSVVPRFIDGGHRECEGASELSRMRCDLCRRNVTELRAAGDLPLREFKDRRVFGLSACPGRQTCYLCARCYRVHVPPDQQTRARE